MIKVLYTCSFVPPEWIEAHGLTPCRIVPPVAHDSMDLPEAGVCPFARSFAEKVLAAPDDVAAVFTTRCDQMRRLYDLVSARRRGPTFLLNLPATWRNPAATTLYAGELRRFGRWLFGLSGAAVPRADWVRRVIDMDAPRPANVVMQASRLQSEDLGAVSQPHARPVRLAVTGGPLPGHSEFLEQVARLGGTVVLDATENGLALRACRYDRQRLAADPAGELARAYLAIPSIHQRPNYRFFGWLGGSLAACRAEGLILRRYVWCDLWHAEARAIANDCGLPMLDLEIEADSPSVQIRAATRIEGFLEMIRSVPQAVHTGCGAAAT